MKVIKFKIINLFSILGSIYIFVIMIFYLDVFMNDKVLFIGVIAIAIYLLLSATYKIVLYEDFFIIKTCYFKKKIEYKQIKEIGPYGYPPGLFYIDTVKKTYYITLWTKSKRNEFLNFLLNKNPEIEVVLSGWEKEK